MRIEARSKDMSLKRPKEVTFEFQQPPAPYPPSQRSGALVGPSGVGKTTTALAMLMGPYRNCYERVYVFSPSCAPGVDSAWDAWRKHVRTHMEVSDDEQAMWSEWVPHELEELIERHKSEPVPQGQEAEEGLLLSLSGWRLCGRRRQGNAQLD